MEKCKIRAAAEREHDAPEIPAHAFRLVNTSVFSTSAFSIRCLKTNEFVSFGYYFQAFFMEKRVFWTPR